jgi:hypothetical protein
MSFIPGSKPTAPPTARGLLAGKAFTAAVFALALTGMLAAVFATDDPRGRDIAAAGFVGAAALYLVAGFIMFVRGDYILRMFGCAWPLILAKADELQKAQRQRAFSFTFIVFLSVASLWVGAHIGVLSVQQTEGEALTGLLPGEAWPTAAVLVFVFFTLTLLPQAYLAWTLKPLDEEEAE